ncbi:MAG: hypothetical protein V1709_11315 [Planctomycetota bacterium]
MIKIWGVFALLNNSLIHPLRHSRAGGNPDPPDRVSSQAGNLILDSRLHSPRCPSGQPKQGGEAGGNDNP